MMSKNLFAGAVLLLWASLGWALPVAHFPHATIVNEKEAVVDDYLLTLGGLKKVDGRWLSEREQRLTGSLQRWTLELADGYTPKEAFAHYRQQFLQQDGQELFLCEGRGCGSSSAWANNRFNERQLYGLDQEQIYTALAVQKKDGLSSYVALYAVQRGNRRSYVHLEVLTSSERLALFSDAEVIVERLRQGGSFTLPATDNGVQTEAQLSALVSVMKRQSTWTVALVGLDTSTGSLQQQQERSRKAAEAIGNQLQEEGIDPTRIQVFGLGGLVPDALPAGHTQSVSLVRIIPGR